MTRYLVLYDAFGNCQRVAQANNRRDFERFREAGFIEVSEEEYNRCAAIVEDTRVSDIAMLTTATSLLGALASLGQRQRPELPDFNRDQIERLIEQFSRNARNRTQQLFAGEIDIQQWYDGMSRQILRNRVAARAAAVGGTGNLSQADIDAARQATRRELTYLSQFRQELENGTVTEAQAQARAAMYGGGAREQSEDAYQAAIGLPALPAQPGVRTVCRKSCKCRWEIRRLEGNGNWDCYWRRSPVDSCETCSRREDVFNPLQIRAGIIQPFSTAGIYAG